MGRASEEGALERPRRDNGREPALVPETLRLILDTRDEVVTARPGRYFYDVAPVLILRAPPQRRTEIRQLRHDQFGDEWSKEDGVLGVNLRGKPELAIEHQVGDRGDDGRKRAIPRGTTVQIGGQVESRNDEGQSRTRKSARPGPHEAGRAGKSFPGGGGGVVAYCMDPPPPRPVEGSISVSRVPCRLVGTRPPPRAPRAGREASREPEGQRQGHAQQH